jgi:MFS family permease
LDNIARAFAHRNYRVYVIGNSISLIGWWLERVAVGWLTWTLTHSGAWLGLISLADFLPVLFLAPFAGVLADRRDRVRTIRITQLIGCAQASLLAILVVSDAMTIEILFALVLMLGIASGVAQPSRLALIPTLVDRESLASALAINSVIFNLARFIGPALVRARAASAFSIETTGPLSARRGSTASSAIVTSRWPGGSTLFNVGAVSTTSRPARLTPP